MESGDSEGGGVENDEKNVELRAANPWRTFQILGVKKDMRVKRPKLSVALWYTR